MFEMRTRIGAALMIVVAVFVMTGTLPIGL
jgi:hypothetical protein